MSGRLGCAPILFFLLLIGCAKMAPPTGGPVDRDAPRILNHTPAADATQVSADATVEILFSKSMNRRTVEEAVFIAPEGASKFNWNGNRLNITFGQPLLSDRTYVVTVGSGARDLRRNSLDRSYTFAFATGDEINQGSIVGHVFADDKPAAGANVWAFDLERLTGRMGSGAPDYRTQTGKDGGYEFSKLSATRYRIMAFTDDDRDQRLDAGESMGVGSADLLVEGEGKTAAGYLAIAKTTRPLPRLKRMQAVHDRAILLEFSHPVDAEQVTVEVEGLEVGEIYSTLPGSSRLYAVTAVQEGGREYRIRRLAVGDSVHEVSEPLRGRGRSDNTPPTVLEKQPSGEIGPSDSLRVFFSEAMEPERPINFWIATDSTQTPAGEWSWQNPTTLSFAFAAPMAPGDHSLVGRHSRLTDRSGNAVADSLITFRFTVLEQGEMPSVSGRAGTDTSQVWVVADMRAGSRTYKVMAEPTGEYVISGMVPGSYSLYGYIDHNGNGRQDYGSLDPYLAAEPYLRAPEVVELTTASGTVQIDLLPYAGD